MNMAEQVFLEQDEEDAAASEHSQRSNRTAHMLDLVLVFENSPD